MASIRVTHSAGQYEVLIAPGIATEGAARIAKVLGERRLVVVTDEVIRAALVAAGRWPALDATIHEVAVGEAAKDRDTWARLTDLLLVEGVGRDSALVAIGGGSVGDLTGFVAATYLRGIPFVQVPTTLLAMVDASVGGKVGVDTTAGKNLVGAFHPPALVLADPLLLATLPDPTYREGLAEALKHGVVADAKYFEWIVANAAELKRRDPESIAYLVERSVEIKAGIVSRDEHEAGERAILNAGHTVAHALESTSGFDRRHGEAVALGLVAECRIGERMGITEKGTADRVAAALTSLELPTHDPRSLAGARDMPTTHDLLTAMRLDKKNRAGVIRMALPVAVGQMAREENAWTLAVSEKDIAAEEA